MNGIESFDLAIIGGGVIGVATARAFLQAHPGLKVCLLEREPELARHQSGRNSGVVHVGINQKPGTTKAKFVVEGSRRIRKYCRENNVPLIEDGILVVAKDEAELSVLNELQSRGSQNGAVVEIIDEERLKQLEPHAAGIGALLAPEGASFDSRGYVLALAHDAHDLGVEFHFSEPVLGLDESSAFVEVHTTERTIRARVLVCAAGLHADRLAHKLGLGLRYQMVPFRGEYHELVPQRRSLVRSHLYPAPNLQFPFLGVHLSRTYDGRVLVGPGAVLAMGRESYDKSVVNLKDVFDMARRMGFWKLFRNKEFRQMARREWKKSLFASEVAREAQQLLPELRQEDLIPARAGIRAQLVSSDGALVDDLTIEQSPRSIHVLNAVSPALTCSLPFADHLCELVQAKL
jgi:L-2-hydroxyglutarate oxidase